MDILHPPKSLPEQRTTFHYRLVYTHEDKRKVLAKFEVSRPIKFPPEGISFGSSQTIVGSITSKAIDDPRGGYIYRFHISHETAAPINKWLFTIHAKNIVWNNTIHLDKAELYQQICSKIDLC